MKAILIETLHNIISINKEKNNEIKLAAENMLSCSLENFQKKLGDLIVKMICARYHFNTVILLLSELENLNLAIANHDTSFIHFILKSSYSEDEKLHLIKIARSNGAHMNVLDKDGHSPVMCAFKIGALSIARFLSESALSHIPAMNNNLYLIKSHFTETHFIETLESCAKANQWQSVLYLLKCIRGKYTARPNSTYIPTFPMSDRLEKALDSVLESAITNGMMAVVELPLFAVRMESFRTVSSRLGILLEKAITNKKWAAVKYFIKQKYSINPLLFYHLINCGAPVSLIKDSIPYAGEINPNKALALAVQGGDVPTVVFAIQELQGDINSNDPAFNNTHPIVKAAITGNSDLFNHLMLTQPIPKAVLSTVLPWVVSQSCFTSTDFDFEKWVLALITWGVPIEGKDDAGNTALMLAVQAGDLMKIKTLINAGADVNTTNNKGENVFTTHMRFNKEHDLEIYTLLFQHGFHPQPTLLLQIFASAQKYTYDHNNLKSKVEAILKYGKINLETRFNTRDENNNATALMLAAKNELLNETRLLLQYGANIEASRSVWVSREEPQKQQTALDIAKTCGYDNPLVNLLKKAQEEALQRKTIPSSIVRHVATTNTPGAIRTFCTWTGTAATTTVKPLVPHHATKPTHLLTTLYAFNTAARTFRMPLSTTQPAITAASRRMCGLLRRVIVKS